MLVKLLRHRFIKKCALGIISISILHVANLKDKNVANIFMLIKFSNGNSVGK